MSTEKPNRSTHPCIVVWDDQQGFCCPLAHDEECEGALCSAGGKDKIALFANRAEALRAINISAKFAALQKAQGKPANTDFLEGRKNLRVVALRAISERA